MIILGIETATSRVGCAVGGAEGVIGEFHTSRPRRHAEILAPAIEFVTRQAQIALSEVSVVAVDHGPGLFTGLRVGVATAKAVAQALRVPVIGISSLDLLAHPLRHAACTIVPAVDARRGEVYWASYRHVPGGIQRLTPYRVCRPDELAAELQATGEECLVVGDGALRYADVIGRDRHVTIGTSSEAYPPLASLVTLAHARALREEFVQPSELEVLYLRRPDAEPSAQTRDHGGSR